MAVQVLAVEDVPLAVQQVVPQDVPVVEPMPKPQVGAPPVLEVAVDPVVHTDARVVTGVPRVSEVTRVADVLCPAVCWRTAADEMERTQRLDVVGSEATDASDVLVVIAADLRYPHRPATGRLDRRKPREPG